MLQVTLLGAPSVTWHGRPVRLPRKAVRAMLYVLASKDGATPRDHLAHVLHNDTAADLGLPRVRIGLAQLRDALAAAGAPKDLVIATPHSAALSEAALVDVRRIDALGRRHEPLDDEDDGRSGCGSVGV